MQPIVIQTENLPQECSDWLAQRCDLHVCPADSLRFQELLPQAKGLVIRTYTTVDFAMIENAPNLVVIGRAGVGVDNIELEACKDRGITVVHTPDANSESVVEFTLTTMLSNMRTRHEVSTGLSQDEWNALRDSSMTTKEFSELTLGIIGFGRIGSRLGKIARLLGFKVLFHDLLTIDETNGCTQVSLDELLRESDVISTHVDGRTENRHLCNSEMFHAMKQNVLFMNAARGCIVDSYALTDFLQHNQDAHAILDVHEPEPITSEYPLLHVSNATLYPHIACKTKKATVNMGWVVKDIDAVLRNEQPNFQIT
jgi:D-3-phosphoglycerate dehydrogenase